MSTSNPSRHGSSGQQRVFLSPAEKEEKMLVNRIRAFQKEESENKRCADCGDVGPTYVCMDYGTFVCTTCSGLHREFNHKVKGVSVSKWSPEEVETVLSRGNAEDKSKYLKYYDSQDRIRQPEPGSLLKLREWIRYKYLEKKWLEPRTPPPSPTALATQPSMAGNQQSRTSKVTHSNHQSGTRSKKHPRSLPQFKSSEASRGIDLLGLGFSMDPFAAQTLSPTPPQQGLGLLLPVSPSRHSFSSLSSTTPMATSDPFNLLDDPSSSVPSRQQHMFSGDSSALLPAFAARPAAAAAKQEEQQQEHPSMLDVAYPSSSKLIMDGDLFAMFDAPSAQHSQFITHSASTTHPPSIASELMLPLVPAVPPSFSLLPSSPISHSTIQLSSRDCDPFNAVPSVTPLTTSYPLMQATTASSLSSPTSLPIPSSFGTSTLETQIASHLATSLVSQQRYQGDPFSDIPFDIVCEPRPIDAPIGALETQRQLSLPSGVILSPSMVARNINGDSPPGDKSLDILINQVASLKEALQEPCPTANGSLTYSTAPEPRRLISTSDATSGSLPQGKQQLSFVAPSRAHRESHAQLPFSNNFDPSVFGADPTPSLWAPTTAAISPASDTLAAWADFEGVPPFAEGG